MNDVLLQYGLAGVAVVGLAVAVRVLFAQVSAGADAERLRADRNEDEVRKLNASIRTDILPVLVRATEILAEHAQRRDRP